jgi:hypothetical protein
MSYAGRSPRYDIPWWDTGEISSGTWNKRISTELDYLVDLLDSLATGAGYDGTVNDGFAGSAGAGLSLNVAAGLGMVDGIRIYASGATAKTLSDNSTLYIYLKLTATSFYDRSFTVEESLSGAGMADAILIAKAVTAAGAISSVDNYVTGRTPRLRVPGLPGLRVVAPAGAAYTDPEAAIEGAPAGAVILIMPGTYTITGTITIPNNNISILGVNRDACVLSFTTADANDCIDLNGKDGCRLRSLTISAIAGKTGRGIYGSGCTDTLMYDLAITSGPLSYSIYLTNSSHRAIIEECYISGTPTRAITIENSNYGMIVNNVVDISTTDGYGLSLNATSYSAIMGNTVRLSGTTARWCFGAVGSDLAVIGNNAIVSTPSATSAIIYLWASVASGARLMANNNVVASAGGAGRGIYLVTTNPYNLDDCVISGNVINACATGILVADARCRYTLIHGNNVRGCTAGISDSGTSTTSADNITP